MRSLTKSLAILLLMFFYQIAVQAQTNGLITGTIIDTNGAVVPNATITVKGDGGQEFTATTSSNGTFRIPAVQNGFYTVTITATGFKTSVVSNVKVDIGTPSTVDATLEVGAVGETVEITSGGEVLQTQTATVGTTITGRQITETPIASRDALDLVGLLPGTSTVGAPRRSSVNGLPKSGISITIDGVDVQDNYLRSSDGYFTSIRPRVDSIEEVNVSTANGGAEATGDGAIQVRFMTRRGTNDYKGSIYWQVRNTALNAAYWYNNRDLKPLPGSNKAPRDDIKLNQPGFRIGGPLPFPNFGEGGSMFNSGKDRAFFFVNYELFRLPQSIARTRTILTPDAQAGIFKYLVGTETRSVNVYDIAATRGLVTTIDPTISAVLNSIRASTATTGVISNIVNTNGVITDPNRQLYNFQNSGYSRRNFLTTRFDVNINKSNSIEFIFNRQNFLPSVDFINGNDTPFPGGDSFGQSGIRKSYTGAVRSTITQNLVNEARLAIMRSPTAFAQGNDASQFALQGGRFLSLGAAGVTNIRSVNSSSVRLTPTIDFTNSLTWLKGNHSIVIGGQYKTIKSRLESTSPIVPTISFGADPTNDATIRDLFTGGANGTLPGATSGQAGEALSLYAQLVGRVTGYSNTAFLGEDGTYQLGAAQLKNTQVVTAGLFIQDSWRYKPNLTINYGFRWQPQLGATVQSANFSRLENNDQVYGVSGVGNFFTPGITTGTAPRVVGLEIGEKVYPDDLKNFSPSVGIVWSPEIEDGKFMQKIFGSNGKSVFRGGYSISFIREGLSLINSIVGANPGGSLTAARSFGAGTLTYGTLLRDPNNVNLTPLPFTPTPTYPLPLNSTHSTNAFSPDLKTGAVHSFSFGYQRELDKNTVIEFRYVGNRGRDLVRQININQINVIENGFAEEFKLAQQNLYANIAANYCPPGSTTVANCQYNFAYAGPGTGTNPLPTFLAYIIGNTNGYRATLTPGAIGSSGSVSSAAAANAALYTSAIFRTSAGSLNRVAPGVTGLASSLDGTDARRANAIAAGLPANFLWVNPATPSGSYLVENGTLTWYDSGVIEVRRRLSDGIRAQASYVWSKAQSNFYANNDDIFANLSKREGVDKLAKTVQPYDLRHNFKVDMTFDLPFGKGQNFFSNAGGLVNALVGGFSILPTFRWQSGSPIQLGNAQLVGMTVKELQKEVKVRKNEKTVTWLPDDIILNSQQAFSTDLLKPNGYSNTYVTDGSGPKGRFIAPLSYNNCQQRYTGECGFNNLVIYGPSFYRLDVGVSKRISFDEKRNIQLSVNFLDALNHPNFRVGGFASDLTTTGCCGATFGQLGTGSTYRDINTTNDPGGRIIDILFRFNF